MFSNFCEKKLDNVKFKQMLYYQYPRAKGMSFLRRQEPELFII